MKETKFTPGPWRVENFLNIIQITEDREENANDEICKIFTSAMGQKEHTKANARLISYSPDMYSALEETALFMDNNGIGHTAHIWELLTKIKGE